MERSRAAWRLVMALVALGAQWPTGSRAMCPATEYSGTLRTPTDAPLPPELPLLVVVVTDRTGTPAQMVQGNLVPIELQVLDELLRDPPRRQNPPPDAARHAILTEDPLSKKPKNKD